MGIPIHNTGPTPLATLQQFVSKPSVRTELCELCSGPIAAVHQHLLELEKRKLVCCCDACAILFHGANTRGYRRIPRDVSVLRDFVLDDLEWEILLIPINLAFFYYSSFGKKEVANYPSPAGAMESSLELEYWNTIVKRNPILNKFEPDVEALLVNRIANPPQYYRVPIDQCFRLVGIIRKHWHGLSGGTEVWKEVDELFQQLTAASGGQRA